MIYYRQSNVYYAMCYVHIYIENRKNRNIEMNKIARRNTVSCAAVTPSMILFCCHFLVLIVQKE